MDNTKKISQERRHNQKKTKNPPIQRPTEPTEPVKFTTSTTGAPAKPAITPMKKVQPANNKFESFLQRKRRIAQRRRCNNQRIVK
jgi:hypothetical protein